MNKICIDDLWILPTKIDLHELSCPLLSLLMTETCWMLLQTISIKNSLKHFLECLWQKTVISSYMNVFFNAGVLFLRFWKVMLLKKISAKCSSKMVHDLRVFWWDPKGNFTLFQKCISVFIEKIWHEITLAWTNFDVI